MSSAATPSAATPSDGSPDVVRQSSSELALEFIRARVTSGEFPPGMRLKERDLSEQLGLSRVPVREALLTLVTEGFATHSPRRGVVVSRLDPRRLDEIFEVREALEAFACELAIRNASDAEAAELLAVTAVADEALAAGNRAEVDAANGRFHDLLLAMAHNEVLIKLLDPLQSRIHWLLRQNDGNAQLCIEHRRIATAVAQRHIGSARRAALAHVRTSRAVAFARLFRD